jgi:hypothetical protein
MNPCCSLRRDGVINAEEFYSIMTKKSFE